MKDTVLIDIGAMIGDTSVYFAMNPNVKKVIAIEPNPASYVLLKKNVSECPIKKIETMQVAVSCSEGFSRMSHPYATGFNRTVLAESGIRTVTLQSLLDGFRGKRIAIKCDVEGAELSIFRFFTTMQVPILLGREIQADDTTSSHLVAVVNQVFAEKNFGDRNPLGQILTAPHGCATCAFEIVGVSGNALVGRDVRDKPGPTVFVPYTANLWGPMQTMIYELRTAGNPLSYVRTVRELIHEVDPRLPVSEIQTQSELIDATINREVVFARLCTGFALLALVIACVGLYGAMSYNVARRTGEIGIRMALGAPRGRVVWMVLREVLLLAAAGLVISVPAALFGTKLLKSFLYETQPNDPISLTVAAVSLVVAATLAGYLPARKASCIDPMVALRHE